jgi:hypothetical protein
MTFFPCFCGYIIKCLSDLYTAFGKQVLLSADYFCNILSNYAVLHIHKLVGSKMDEMSWLE